MDLGLLFLRTIRITKGSSETAKHTMTRHLSYFQTGDITKDRLRTHRWTDKVYLHIKTYTQLKEFGEMGCHKGMLLKDVINKTLRILAISKMGSKMVLALIHGITAAVNIEASSVGVWCMTRMAKLKPRVVSNTMGSLRMARDKAGGLFRHKTVCLKANSKEMR